MRNIESFKAKRNRWGPMSVSFGVTKFFYEAQHESTSKASSAAGIAPRKSVEC